ncbi:MAG TPA: CHAT domain-containing protein [Polyangiaceae bacterium]
MERYIAGDYALRVLAAAASVRGDVARAASMLRRCIEVGEALILEARASATEDELASLLDFLRLDEEMVYSLAAQRPENADVKKLELMTSLLRKGRSIDEVTRAYEVFQAAAAQQPGGWDPLREARSRFALKSLLGGTEEAIAAEWSKVTDIERKLTLSASLAQYAQGVPATNTNPGLVIAALDAGLPLGGAFVDYTLFRRFDFGSVGQPPRGRGAFEYLAVVVKKHVAVDVVPLGAAERVDNAVAKVAQVLSSPGSSPLPGAKEAYDVVFAPLRDKLRYSYINYSHQYVYICPDGELSRVPFDALHDGTAYLADTYVIAYATSGRDAFIGSRSGVRAPTSVSVFTAPDFSRSIPRGLHANRPEPLPGALGEATDIQGIFPSATSATGDKATRSELLSTHGVGILHIATHAFFLDDPGGDSDRLRGFSVKPITRSTSVAVAPAVRRTPLTRAGLVLAGRDDSGGMVTALEIAGMELAGTQLAVLSACDTAHGTTRPGQGVYGLMRALFAAGAETAVASLWKVDDSTARTFMKLYYGALAHGAGRVEALRTAAAVTRASHPHPNAWAAFVAYGSDRALPGAPATAIGVPPPRHGGIVSTPLNTQPSILGPH